MRGGALRLYTPTGVINQNGRGIGGVLKKAGTMAMRDYIVPYVRRAAKRKGRQMLATVTRKAKRMMPEIMGQSGGAFKRRRRRRRQRRRDIFQY